MRVKLVIVICIVILGMVVDASINSRVHGEYIRRRNAYGRSRFNLINELPTGVHSEYIRRWVHRQSRINIFNELHARVWTERRRVHGKPDVKILHEIPAIERIRHPTLRVRQHFI